jgi:hypothetical protein
MKIFGFEICFDSIYLPIHLAKTASSKSVNKGLEEGLKQQSTCLAIVKP